MNYFKFFSFWILFFVHNLSCAQEASSTSLFDRSSGACYHRLTDLRVDGWSAPTSNSGRREFSLKDLRKENIVKEVFGIPIEQWNESVLSDFHETLYACTPTESSRVAFDEKFISATMQYLPIHIEEIRENNSLIEKLHESSALQDISISCADIVSFPLKHTGLRGMEREKNFLPYEKTFNKNFINFTNEDYNFIEKKIDICKNFVDSTLKKFGSIIVDESTSQNISDSSKIEKLAKDMQEWKAIQTQEIDKNKIELAAANQVQSQLAEGDRRKNSPTLAEKLADYLIKIGVIGIIGSGALMTKIDKRFKTGFKDNKKPPGWLYSIAFTSIGMLILGYIINNI